MTTWADVERVALGLPDVTRGQAHEGSPALEVHGRQFARLRSEDGRGLVQFWVRDRGVQEGLLQNEPDTFVVHHRFETPSLEAWLDSLDEAGLHEVLRESWWARGTATLRRQHPELD